MLKGITDVWDEDLAGIVSDLEYEVLSSISDTMNIYIVGFTDSVRNDIKDDVGKILVLSSIADNTDDKNLKKACQVCMADSFNASIRAIGDFALGEVVDKGKDYLVSKQTIQKMFTGSTWDKIIESDQYLKMNTEKIPDITIRNYTKVKLTSLKPNTDTAKITLKVKEKKEFPCTGISYLSNVKYSSDNKKVAKINSSGEIQAKKAGTTYIRCKVEQYGDTYNLVCKVTVKKEGNTKNPTSAYRNLIQSYEKKYGEAQLNEQKQFWTGLCYAKLLDFNNDGINELRNVIFVWLLQDMNPFQA